MIIDASVSIILFFFGFLGLKRGLIQQIFSTISIILSIKISFYFYHHVSLLIDFHLISSSVKNIGSWIILFIILLYLFSIIRSKIISKMFSNSVFFIFQKSFFKDMFFKSVF